MVKKKAKKAGAGTYLVTLKNAAQKAQLKKAGISLKKLPSRLGPGMKAGFGWSKTPFTH